MGDDINLKSVKTPQGLVLNIGEVWRWNGGKVFELSSFSPDGKTVALRRRYGNHEISNPAYSVAKFDTYFWEGPIQLEEDYLPKRERAYGKSMDEFPNTVNYKTISDRIAWCVKEVGWNYTHAAEAVMNAVASMETSERNRAENERS